MARRFAAKLTKEDLMKAGIKDIYYDPDEPKYHIIGNDDKEVKLYKDKRGYLAFKLDELDADGNKIKVPITRKYKYRGSEKEIDSYNYKNKPMTLSRAVWAWFYGEATEGLVVDHIDNKHTTHYDNRLENLQLITQKENSTKDRPKGPRNSVSEIPCDMTKPLEYYIDKCNYWTLEYKREKEERSSSTNYASNCRHNYCNYRKKIRYWFKHQNEYEEYIRLQSAMISARGYKQERVDKIKQYKQEIKQAKEISKELWHQKIEEYKTFLKNFPFTRAEELEKMFLEEVIQ